LWLTKKANRNQEMEENSVVELNSQKKLFSTDIIKTLSSDLSADMPLALISVDLEGIITHIQGNLIQILNLEIKDLIGHCIFGLNKQLSQLDDLIQHGINGSHQSTAFELGNSYLKANISPIHNNATIQGAVLALFDTTEHQVLKKSLLEVQEQYLLLAEHTQDVITKYTPDGICSYISPACHRVLGYKQEEIVGKSVFHFFHPNDLKSKRKFFKKLLDQPTNDAICYRVKRNDDEFIWLETSTKAVTHDKTGKMVEIIAVSRDITTRKQSEERLLYLANYDSLTGLPNRALFRDRLRRAIARSQRNKTKVALLFLDLDRFKNINDSLGHHAGDQLLRGVSKRLKQYAREGDTIARLGGDEFTVILEGIQSTEDVSVVAEKILELMQAPFRLDGHEVVVTPSIGITLYPDDATDMRSLLKNADTAMYRSKERGRNAYQFYTAGMNAKAYEHLILENSLRHAMERNEFKLYFQPQFDLHSQGIVGIEALLRWEHPEKGLLMPDKFIPFAEDTGLIVPLGDWVLRKACHEAKHWQNVGLEPIRVAVNLSMRQFLECSFVDQVASALNESKLAARYLELEVTESFLAANVEKAAKTLRGLHRLGVHLAIDDFGTGYSSLSYLKRFPLNTLKIDQSFVQDITRDMDSATIVEAIIALGKSLGLNVIAEGVEYNDQVFFLKERSCDLFQGYYFCHPLSGTKLIPWLHRYRRNHVAIQQWGLWTDSAANH